MAIKEMDDIENILEKTDSLFKTCRLAVNDMKQLQKDMSTETNLRFDSEIYHRYDNYENTCTMCVVGAVARGFGIADNEYWAADYVHVFGVNVTSIFDPKAIKIVNRLQTINALRIGAFIVDFYHNGWNKEFQFEQWKSFRKEIYRNYKNNCPVDKKDLNGFIELYQGYTSICKIHKI